MMTVRELIEALKNFDGELPVIVHAELVDGYGLERDAVLLVDNVKSQSVRLSFAEKEEVFGVTLFMD